MNLCDFGCNQQATHKFKNGKYCCSSHVTKCPNIIKSINKKIKGKKIKKQTTSNYLHLKYKSFCKYCGRPIAKANKKPHEKYCLLNPFNVKFCYCGDVILTKNNKTCSHKCANKKFKHPKKMTNVRNISRYICFKYHKKECIICGENLIIDVHHYDNNHKNDKPENLIPMCRTHHSYLHSRYKWIVKECVDEYFEKFKLQE